MSDKFKKGDLVHALSRYVYQPTGGPSAERMKKPLVRCVFLGEFPIHEAHLSYQAYAVSTPSRRVVHVPVVDLCMGAYPPENKEPLTKIPLDATLSKGTKGYVKVEAKHRLQPGMSVSATSEYFQGMGQTGVQDADLCDCLFIGWASWSGMGKQSVAEVYDAPQGKTHYVPRTHLFFLPGVEEVAKPLVDKTEAEVDAAISKVEGLLHDRRMRKTDRRTGATQAAILDRQRQLRGEPVQVAVPEQGEDGFQRISDGYVNHPLFPIFMAVIEQAMYGKGKRHGGSVTPFLEQPWSHYAKMHGRGFLTGQAAKKLEEAASTREGKPFIEELFGAMVYCGMAIIREEVKGGVLKQEILDPSSVYKTREKQNEDR